MEIISLEEFYKQMAASVEGGMNFLLPNGLSKEYGHFNVFNMAEIVARFIGGDTTMPYNRRAYYKISLVKGRNIAEYADKTIGIENSALAFATPKIPYNWVPQDAAQGGFFCVFSSEYLLPGKTGLVLDELPIFRPGGVPIFELNEKETEDITTIFKKMQAELSSSYAYKDDLLRNYLLELIHYGQKLQPLPPVVIPHNASARVSGLFMELLERQFPIAAQGQKINLRTALDYAERLAIHPNHLNKVLKENTGKTTTENINGRIVQEAKILLKHSNWNISEIAYSLGFEQLSHFSNFFKKQTSLSPNEIRHQTI